MTSDPSGSNSAKANDDALSDDELSGATGGTNGLPDVRLEVKVESLQDSMMPTVGGDESSWGPAATR